MTAPPEQRLRRLSRVRRDRLLAALAAARRDSDAAKQSLDLAERFLALHRATRDRSDEGDYQSAVSASVTTQSLERLEARVDERWKTCAHAEEQRDLRLADWNEARLSVIEIEERLIAVQRRHEVWSRLDDLAGARRARRALVAEQLSEEADVVPMGPAR